MNSATNLLRVSTTSDNFRQSFYQRLQRSGLDEELTSAASSFILAPDAEEECFPKATYRRLAPPSIYSRGDVESYASMPTSPHLPYEFYRPASSSRLGAESFMESEKSWEPQFHEMEQKLELLHHPATYEQIQPSLEERKTKKPKSAKDLNLVTWSGPKDPDNPKNWPSKKKWAMVIVVSLFAFISPLSSSMIAPGLHQMAIDLGGLSEVETQLSLSVFILGFAMGPLFIGPFSEVFGRVRVLQLGNLFFIAWNLACGFARTKTQIILFRFLGGVGGSAALAVGGGVLGDLFTPDKRGRAVSIYALAPVLSPAIGPIAGAFTVQGTTWRWIFWSTTIFAVFLQLLGLIFLHESFAPVLLKQKADRLRKATRNEKLYTQFDTEKRLVKLLPIALVRPFRMLFTQPIIQLMVIYNAYLFGLLYLIISTLPRVWEGFYGERVSIAGLHYIALGIGTFLGALINGQFSDRIYRRLKTQNNGTRRPEFRIPLLFIGSSIVPVGIFMYGWSVAAKLHWIVPDIGLAIFGIGCMMCLQTMPLYLIDTYTRFAASGIAASVVLRSIAGFTFPMFGPAMYKALGYGWGNSILGFAATVIGMPAPFIFWFYGERLRKMSTYATG